MREIERDWERLREIEERLRYIERDWERLRENEREWENFKILESKIERMAVE